MSGERTTTINNGSNKSQKQRMTSEELDARLRFIVGITLALTMVGIIGAVLYSLIFVVQPMTGQAPNDAEFFKLVTPIATFLTGALSGIMVTSSGRKQDETSQSEPTSSEE